MTFDLKSYPALLSPLPVGHTVLKNRATHTSMTTVMLAGNRISPGVIQYHVNRALGGVALTVTEPLGMVPQHAQLPRPQVWDDSDGDGFRRWAEAVERHDCRLLGQIQDNGRGRHYVGRTLDAIGASVLPDDLSWTVPRAMTAGEIEHYVDSVAQSSRRLQEYGFSGVELSCGHGHLFHQFLSPWSNRRDDTYGRDWAGRTRFVAEMVQAIRAACGNNFLIALKLPGHDGLPGSIGVEEAGVIAKILCQPGLVDLVSFCWGSHSRTLEMHLPDRFGPRVTYLEAIRRLKHSVNGVPMMAVGRITDPAEAEAVLQEGAADLVGLGRTLIADPAWLSKAAHNRAHDIRYCLSCNTCWGTIIAFHAPVVCVNNPRVGRVDETDFWPQPAATPRRVTVVGAGVAGLEAAWVAAARGHRVTVLGASREPGGKARTRALLPGGETITSIYDYQTTAANRAGAHWEMGSIASLDDVLATEPDTVVLACGSTMIPPDWVPPDMLDAVPDLRAAMASLEGLQARQPGTAVIFDMDHSEGTYAAARGIAGAVRGRGHHHTARHDRQRTAPHGAAKHLAPNGTTTRSDHHAQHAGMDRRVRERELGIPKRLHGRTWHSAGRILPSLFYPTYAERFACGQIAGSWHRGEACRRLCRTRRIAGRNRDRTRGRKYRLIPSPRCPEDASLFKDGLLGGLGAKPR